jgi:Putative peptidoglycan binding domain
MGLALLVSAALGFSGKLMAGAQTSQKTSKVSTAGKSSATGKSSTSGKSHVSTKKTRAKRGRKEKGQAAPTAERISEIQAALAKDGSFSGSPNGKWDDATVEAMKKFQTTRSESLRKDRRMDTAKTGARLANSGCCGTDAADGFEFQAQAFLVSTAKPFTFRHRDLVDPLPGPKAPAWESSRYRSGAIVARWRIGSVMPDLALQS